MKSTRTDFRQIGWRDLLVAAQRLRSEADGLSVLAETVLDLFLRDVERFTSPLKAYRGVLRQVENAAGADEDAGVRRIGMWQPSDIWKAYTGHFDDLESAREQWSRETLEFLNSAAQAVSDSAWAQKG